VVRVVFGFAATSTSCERSFSLARHVIGHRRHRLLAWALESLIFTQYNDRVIDPLCEEGLIEITAYMDDSDIPLYIEGEGVQLGDTVFSKAMGVV
jgi:hypothetical protein